MRTRPDTTTLPIAMTNGASELVEMYRVRDRMHVEMGRRFLAYRREHGVSQQEVARRTGITPGTIHHLESLLSLAPELIRALEAGRINFKEARSIADIAGHERQIEMAEPFLSGRLSSVYVEAVVRWAKARPDADCETVVELVMARAKVKPKHWKRPVPAPVQAVTVSAAEVQQMMLDLAARLTPLATQPYPEIATMRLKQTARILTDRLQAAKLV